MITPILEKLLLKGFAKNKIHHLGYGMFSQLEIPTDSFIVIHKIYWNGWLNQKKEQIGDMTWKEFFKWNEYALKVQSDKETPLYYQFRNEVNFQFFYDGINPPIKLSDPINTAQYDDYILMTPKKPVIFDTWIAAYDYLNFTISRNALMPSAGNFSLVNQYSLEQVVPNGIFGQLVILDMTLTGTQGTTTTINPPGTKAASPPIIVQPNNTSNYLQLLDPRGGPPGNEDEGSFLHYPLGGSVLKQSEYVNNPLISFEYCIVKKNTGGILSNL